MKFYSVKEASKLLNISRQAVQHAIKTGQIKPFHKKPYLVYESELQKYLTSDKRKYSPKK